MRCTIKMIVKFGLIAEIITAIIGSIGEYCLRYSTYSMAMDELFGVYNSGGNLNGENIMFINHGNNPWYARQHHHSDWPSNHQHYDHLTGESFQLSQLNAMAVAAGAKTKTETVRSKTKSNPPSHPQTFISIFFQRFYSWWFPQSTTSTSTIFDEHDEVDFLENFDPRPLIVLSVLIILNMIFILAVCMEYLPLIGVMSTTWLLYLIMLFVIVRVMNDETAKRYVNLINRINNSAVSDVQTESNNINLLSSKIDWSSMLPSAFIILIVIIILLFTIILIALITEERRQIAARIRARSACIPLVKSRDMDLDDI